ncbi:uncharacterized protein TNCV_3200241 [Trichonephila clavipes]|nr:uncharacterized protein TNCV_3200241 [Trichonephila clavipes]
MSKQMEHHWCRQFSEGRQSVHDEERSGRPSLIFVDLVELVRQRVMENRRFTITELSSRLPQISENASGSEKNAVAAGVEWSRYRFLAGLVTSSSPVPLKTRRVGERCTLKLSRAQSSRWCGVIVRRGVPAQVSSTSLDHGSKLRCPSPKVIV